MSWRPPDSWASKIPGRCPFRPPGHPHALPLVCPWPGPSALWRPAGRGTIVSRRRQRLRRPRPRPCPRGRRSPWPPPGAPRGAPPRGEGKPWFKKYGVFAHIFGVVGVPTDAQKVLPVLNRWQNRRNEFNRHENNFDNNRFSALLCFVTSVFLRLSSFMRSVVFERFVFFLFRPLRIATAPKFKR